MKWTGITIAVAGIVGGHAADDGTAFFESRIRPVLADRCHQCHAGTKTKGGLALDTRDGWKKGGDHGPAIVPGKPDESRLIAALSHADADLQMPPKALLESRCG